MTHVFRSLVLFFFCISIYSQSKENTISGVVTNFGKPLPAVNVSVKGTDKGIQTDSLGAYSLKVRSLDIVVFSHVGMISQEIMVEDVARVINISMEPLVNELDEVVVSKRKRKTQENLAKNYFSDASIIKSTHGYLSPDLVGYDLRVIDGKDLNTDARDILDAIAKQLPGTVVRENPNGSIGRFLFAQNFGSLRGAAPLSFEVDGTVLKEVPTWLDIRTVIRVAIMPAPESIYRYGKEGTGGMAIINTNNTEYGFRDSDGRAYDSARLDNNTYTNDAINSERVLQNSPSYLKQLKSSKHIQEALSVYNQNRKAYGTSYSYILDVCTVLLDKFEGKKEAKGIVQEYKRLFEENPIALKALAYVYEAYAMPKEAHEVYRNIYKLRPAYSQSYMDLANSYRNMGDFKQAAAIYSRYDHLKEIDYLKKDSTSFLPVINREINNLFVTKGDEMFDFDKKNDYVWEETFEGTRLVFEWNDGEAEFELQFVNPLGAYHTAVHSMVSDSKRIRDEKVTGYSCEEYLIDNSLQGDWLVNATYLGNKSLTPTYLKTTVYFDYGSADQRKEVRVFRLGLKGVNQELFKLYGSGKLVSK